MKLTERDNYRVEAEVPSSSYGKKPAHDEMMRRAKELKAQIDRHCDGESSRIEFDTNHTCSFCGRPWTEDSPTYNGGCCDKDEENNPVLPSTSTEQP